ncbi:MAG: right-handed parallel beta-helix repeat-containing protein [Ignavibacteriales bacterium]|nr:right-handed parallel beta-helix repeat-containing protein [Ignavibacteriales bacterium]
MKKIFFAIILLKLIASVLSAEIISGPKSIPKIQELIDQSKNGDTVLVPPNIYYENINFNGKNIVVASYYLVYGDSSYIQNTVINGMRQGCAVIFENGEDSTAELNGFTIRDGASYSDSLYGGGITIRNNSSAKLKNLIIDRNYTEECGGAGILCIENSQLQMENLLISNNIAIDGSGGGVSVKNSIIKMQRVKIKDNEAKIGGGVYLTKSKYNIIDVIINENIATFGAGIYFDIENIQDNFKHTKVYNNTASTRGGGIFTKSQFELLENSHNSIFLNKANYGSTDIHFESFLPESNFQIYLDTVTVSQPEKYHINIIDKINLNFKTAIFNSVNSDLYISPEGSDSNSGISEDEPLKSISFANLVATTDSTYKRNLNLLNGKFSGSTNNEYFPIYLRSNISLIGNNVESSILDGAGNIGLIKILEDRKNVSVEKLTLQNGKDLNGGGIFISGKNVFLKNLLIKNNIAENEGGGIYIDNSEKVILNNLTIAFNNSKINNHSGGIYFNGEKLFITNCIIFKNIPKDIKLKHTNFNNSELTISNSDLFGGIKSIENSDSVKINWNDNNIESDPMFIGGVPLSYGLKKISPCLNVGTPFLILQGDTIINLSTDEYIGSAPDMGSIESDYLISITDEENLPSEFQLLQNYPNPFNPTTTIEYNIPKSVNANSFHNTQQKSEDNVKVIVFDILGKEIKTLVNEYQKPGYYKIQFNAANLPSGIYYYQLKYGNLYQSKKMLYLK